MGYSFRRSFKMRKTAFTGKSTWTVVAIHLGFRPHQDFQNTNRSQIETCF